MNTQRSRRPKCSARSQRGMTLTELMVALTISLIVMAGVITLYVTNRHAYALQDGLARLQENGRFAIDILARELRMAGNPKDNYGGGGFDTTGTGDGGGDLSDRFAVQYEADIDCLGSNHGGAGSVHAFYIQDATLYCRPNGGTPQPLVDGIENMQLLYGEDSNADGVPNFYVRADRVSNWQHIVSVRIAVLAVTTREVRRQAQRDTYTMLDRAITAPPAAEPADRRLRRVYSSTVVLRNRLP